MWILWLASPLDFLLPLECYRHMFPPFYINFRPGCFYYYEKCAFYSKISRAYWKRADGGWNKPIWYLYGLCLLVCKIRIMVMVLISTQVKRFIRVGDYARFAITAALLSAHPILAIKIGLCTKVCIAFMEDFPWSTLTNDILNWWERIVLIHLWG